MRLLLFLTLLCDMAFAASPIHFVSKAALKARAAPAAKPQQIRIGTMCLDVPSGDVHQGQTLQLWPCNSTPAQAFVIEDQGTLNPPPVVDPPPPNKSVCDGVPAWTTPHNYNIGDKVVYKNQIFTAQNDKNPGYDPIVSYWFWLAGPKCDAVVTNPPPSNPPPDITPPPVNNGGKEIAVYFQSWSAGWASKGSDHALAKLPVYVTTILLAFARPDIAYSAGSNIFVGTGLDFNSDFSVVRDAIKIAQGQGKRVILSIGGATYYNWASFNAGAVAAFAGDLGVDGIDLDYEDTTQICGWSTGGTGCPKDAQFIDIIRRARAAWPRPKLLTTAAWSTGAYGEGEYAASKMDGRQIGSNFGLYVNPLKQAGSNFDRIYIMSYDSGNKGTSGYQWNQALEAYRKLYNGRILIGVESAPEAWGGNVSDTSDARIRALASNGIMLWSWQKSGGVELAQAACTALGMQGCAQALPIATERREQIKDSHSEFHMKTDHKDETK